MARTVTVVASNTTPTVGAKVPCYVKIASTDTNPFQVVGVQVFLSTLTQPAAVTQPAFGAGGGAGLGGSRATQQTVVNNTLFVQYPFEFVAFAPQVPGAATVAYVVNAVVTYSDGTNGTANTTITVSPLS